MTRRTLPIRPLRISSQPSRLAAVERCWLPVWKTRPYLRAASTMRRPSRMVTVSGFSA
jgi:hypothetical protein